MPAEPDLDSPEIEFTVPPYEIEIDNAVAHVVELQHIKVLGNERYVASVWVEWNCYRTPPFIIWFNTQDEFYTKLRVEIAKMKAIILSGKDHIYQKVC